VVQADAIEGVKKGETTLDFVGFNHCFKDIVHSEGLALAGEMVSDGEDGTQVIGRVSPWMDDLSNGVK
jgi:hypothetical protein